MKAEKGLGVLIIDCGKASKQTKGLPIGFFWEGAPPPFNLTIFG